MSSNSKDINDAGNANEAGDAARDEYIALKAAHIAEIAQINADAFAALKKAEKKRLSDLALEKDKSDKQLKEVNKLKEESERQFKEALQKAREEIKIAQLKAEDEYRKATEDFQIKLNADKENLFDSVKKLHEADMLHAKKNFNQALTDMLAKAQKKYEEDLKKREQEFSKKTRILEDRIKAVEAENRRLSVALQEAKARTAAEVPSLQSPSQPLPTTPPPPSPRASLERRRARIGVHMPDRVPTLEEEREEENPEALDLESLESLAEPSANPLSFEPIAAQPMLSMYDRVLKRAEKIGRKSKDKRDMLSPIVDDNAWQKYFEKMQKSIHKKASLPQKENDEAALKTIYEARKKEVNEAYMDFNQWRENRKDKVHLYEGWRLSKGDEADKNYFQIQYLDPEDPNAGYKTKSTAIRNLEEKSIEYVFEEALPDDMSILINLEQARELARWTGDWVVDIIDCDDPVMANRINQLAKAMGLKPELDKVSQKSLDSYDAGETVDTAEDHPRPDSDATLTLGGRRSS